MRIGFALPDLRGGGAERVFITLVNYLAKKNNDVYLILGKKEGPLVQSIDDNVKVLVLGKSGIGSLFRLRKVIIENEIDTLIGTLSMAYVVALLKVFIPKSCKMVSRLGNTISEDLKNHKGIKLLVQRLYQYSLFLSDIIIVQSKYMEDDLNNLLPYGKIKNSTRLIYNPIDVDGVTVLSKDILNGGSHTLVSDEDVISVGRLDTQKDHITTIKAFSRYSNVYQTAKLHILGDGRLRNTIQSEVVALGLQDKIIFHGHIANPYPHILKSKMLVMSSLYEGFSNVILESICLNTPAVVSNCPGGNSEIVINYKNGFLFEVRNDKDMFEKMLLASQCDFDGFSVKEFTVEKISSNYLSVFNEKARYI